MLLEASEPIDADSPSRMDAAVRDVDCCAPCDRVIVSFAVSSLSNPPNLRGASVLVSISFAALCALKSGICSAAAFGSPVILKDESTLSFIPNFAEEEEDPPVIASIADLTVPITAPTIPFFSPSIGSRAADPTPSNVLNGPIP